MNWRSPVGAVLTVSLACNLFAAGAAVGLFLTRNTVGPVRDASAVPADSLDEIVVTLPPDAQLHASSVIDGMRRQLVERIAAQDAARRGAADALGAPVLETAKAESALAALRLRTEELQGSVHKLLVEVASGLSAEERRRLADALLLQSARPDGDPNPLNGLPLL